MSTSKGSAAGSIRQAVVTTLVLLLICGFLFPVLMTGLGSLIFPSQAGGNLIYVDGQPVGSRFVGQEFTDPRFMRGRPSQYHYNTYYVGEDGVSYYNDGSEYAGLSSGSANYANSNPALAERVEGDINNFLSGHPSLTVGDIPGDLLTASGSGLDPHISPASAEIQIPRIAEASGLTEEEIEDIVSENTQGKVFGVFGEETVNVLKVNIEIAQRMGIL